MEKNKNYSKWHEDEMRAFYSALAEQKIEQQQQINFKAISAIVKSRSPKQCYDFYRIRNCNVAQKRHKWTEEEKMLLMEYGQEYMMNWPRIQAELFPYLSINQLRQKFYTLENCPREQSTTGDLQPKQ